MPKRLTPRQLAGRINRRKRGPLTPEGRAALQAAAIAGRPWEHATGPRTRAGRARSRENALRHGDRARVLLSPCVLEALHAARTGAVPLATLQEAMVELMRRGTVKAMGQAVWLAQLYTRGLAGMLGSGAEAG